jgi:hypothetical protein
MEIHSSIFTTDIMLQIGECGTRRAGYKAAREIAFLKLVMLSDEGIYFRTPKRLATLAGCSESICEQVWNLCISAGILKKDEFGCYNANDWIAEHGELFGTDNAPKTRPKRAKAATTPNPSPNPEIAQIGGKESQQSASNAERAFYTDKIAVRPNVFLSHAEIAELKKTYSKEEITKMVDYFSDWKFKKGSNVRTSDYQCIVRWVYKILKEEQQQPTEQAKDSNPFPDWVYGAKK